MNEQLTLAVAAGAGAVVALVVTGLFDFLRRRASRLQHEKSNRIMTSVEEKWTDVDSIIASYRISRITAEEFQSSLMDKIEVINHIYKPCLHLLDIFFVKYTEKLIEDYNRMIESSAGGMLRQKSTSVELRVLEDHPAEEEATVVSKEEIAVKEGPSTSTLPVVESPADEEEAVVAMAGVSGEEDELPIETFLEMETGAGIIGEAIEPAPVAKEQKKEKKAPAISVEMRKDKPATLPVEEKEVAEKEAEYPAETMVAEPESQFTLAEKVSSAAPPSPPPPDIELTEHEAEAPAEDEETMAESAVSFPVKIPFEPHTEPPQPVTPLQQQPSEETVQQPATIYDIEAETIIADRNELLGVQNAAELQTEKIQLGITGDDVSDMLDQFFGGKK